MPTRSRFRRSAPFAVACLALAGGVAAAPASAASGAYTCSFANVDGSTTATATADPVAAYQPGPLFDLTAVTIEFGPEFSELPAFTQFGATGFAGQVDTYFSVPGGDPNIPLMTAHDFASTRTPSGRFQIVVPAYDLGVPVAAGPVSVSYRDFLFSGAFTGTRYGAVGFNAQCANTGNPLVQTSLLGATPEPSPTPTATPSPTPEPTATPSPTPEPTATPSPTPEPTATPSPTPTPAPSPTATPTPTGTPAPSGKLAVTPSTVSFGSQLVGSLTLETVTVKNTGAAALTGLKSTIGGSGAARFIAFGLPATLAKGKSTSLFVIYSPIARGSSSATLTISSSAGSKGVALSGKGIAPVPVISATALAFGNVKKGKTASKAITVKNTGDAPLVLTGYPKIAGTNAAKFTVTGSTAALSPGASRTFTVTFKPTTAGAQKATIQLASGTTPVALTGTGV